MHFVLALFFLYFNPIPHFLVSDNIKSKVEESECKKDDFCDPLRASDGPMEASASDVHCEDFGSQATVPADLNLQLRARKEWISYKKMLMNRFPVSKTSPISLVGICC